LETQRITRRGRTPSAGGCRDRAWHHRYMTEGAASTTWTVDDGFDLDGFLGQPLVAHVATVGRTGPSVRALWYLWEGRAFWWLTEVLQVTARGRAKLHSFEADRARRWGRRYLGPDERHWRRFQGDVFDDPTTRFVALEPTVLRARDLSY
jgi:hypothetical protein